MHERYLGRIESGMDVCDINGDKLGSVERVYRYDLATVGHSSDGGSPPHDEVLEVKTGFLGLGKHLYIPMTALSDVTPGAVFLSKAHDEIKQIDDWSDKPSYLDELQ